MASSNDADDSADWIAEMYAQADAAPSREPERDADGNVVLYRPVGAKELALIEASGWSAFPPRLAQQPIFYPVLNAEYATQIAQRWNTADEASAFAGFVTRFRVKANFIERYDVQCVGGEVHLEYWIPAEELSEFNANLVGPIEVIAEFKGGQV